MRPDDRPSASSYTPGVPLEIDVPEESLVDLLAASAARSAPLVALDLFDATTTYAELDELADRAAEGLRRLGVGAGDRVALVLPNCPQHVVAFYAALRLRAVDQTSALPRLKRLALRLPVPRAARTRAAMTGRARHPRLGEPPAWAGRGSAPWRRRRSCSPTAGSAPATWS